MRMLRYNQIVERHDAGRQAFLTGVELFNRGDFFEAHEAMEEAIHEADDDGN